MNMLVDRVRDFANDESGATAIEYALIASIISISIAGIVPGVRAELTNLFATVNNAMKNANTN